MAAKLAVAREGLILRGLVLGLDVGGELVEFFDRAVHRRSCRIQDELGVVDVFLHALPVSGVILVESVKLLGGRELARVLWFDALMRRYVGRRRGRGLGVGTGGRDGKRRGTKQAGDHQRPRGRKAKERILSRHRRRGKSTASSEPGGAVSSEPGPAREASGVRASANQRPPTTRDVAVHE